MTSCYALNKCTAYEEAGPSTKFLGYFSEFNLVNPYTSCFKNESDLDGVSCWGGGGWGKWHPMNDRQISELIL